MPSRGFNIPTTYLALFGIPIALALVSLLIRSFVEEAAREKSRNDTKREILQTLYWTIPAILLGVLVWYFLRSGYAGKTTPIYFYGILITTGVVAATFLSLAEAKRRGLNTEIIWDVLFWVVLAGIIGARLWHIFTPSADILVLDPTTGKMVNPYFAGGLPHILDIINIRNGGLGIPGAVIGGAFGLWLYCRKKKLPFLRWADTIVPGVALAQAIGRWGNYFNQELYGPPTTLPWGIPISAGARVGAYQDMLAYPETTRFHPLFLYESLWNLLNMAALLLISRRFGEWLKDGDILYLYMIIYSVGRFALDYLRVDFISFNHVFIAVVALIGGGLLFWNHRPQRADA